MFELAQGEITLLSDITFFDLKSVGHEAIFELQRLCRESQYRIFHFPLTVPPQDIRNDSSVFHLVHCLELPSLELPTGNDIMVFPAHFINGTRISILNILEKMEQNKCADLGKISIPSDIIRSVSRGTEC